MAFRDDFYDFRPYVTVGSRRAQAARELATLRKKGRTISPVVIEGRTIAKTFWGEAWCDNLERYGDFANRLPRGRTYVRNGSVVDLQVQPGRVTALVSGSDMYDVSVTVEPVSPTRWRAVCKDCSGAIDSLIELLQGHFSQGVMTRLCQEKTGLFPSPQEIRFTCSCPDWAHMCKHVAAVLYGVGARLDQQPELLFTLRQVDHQDLIAKAGSDLSTKSKRPSSAKVLESEDLSEMFGIEMAQAPATPPTNAPPTAVETSRSSARKAKASAVSLKVTPPVAKKVTEKKTASVYLNRRQGLTPAKRKAIADRMKRYWAERRALAAKKRGSRSS